MHQLTSATPRTSRKLYSLSQQSEWSKPAKTHWNWYRWFCFCSLTVSLASTQIFVNIKTPDAGMLATIKITQGQLTPGGTKKQSTFMQPENNKFTSKEREVVFLTSRGRKSKEHGRFTGHCYLQKSHYARHEAMLLGQTHHALTCSVTVCVA